MLFSLLLLLYLFFLLLLCVLFFFGGGGGGMNKPQKETKIETHVRKRSTFLCGAAEKDFRRSSDSNDLPPVSGCDFTQVPV